MTPAARFAAAVLTALLPACTGPGGRVDVGDGVGKPGDEEACVTPRVRAPFTASGADRVLVGMRRTPRAGPEGRFELRPLVIEGTGTGSVQIEVDGPFDAFDVDGKPLDLPQAIPHTALPFTVLLGATERGRGKLTATPIDIPTGLDCEADTRLLGTLSDHDLAARSLPDAPFAMWSDLFREDEQLEIAIDPDIFADRVGLEADVYVVRHKDPEGWADNPQLLNRGDSVERIAIASGGVEANTHVVWASDLKAGDDHPRSFAVVVDFGRDGRLDPGDLIDGWGNRAGFWVAGNLSRIGSHPTRMERTSGGAWLDQEIWWPTDVAATDEPVPLVVISHGNGHDYRWYGHLADHLSSWGFVVMSHENNTGPGPDAAAETTLTNTEWLLDNRNTLFGGALAGLIDPHRIVWIGHSRGGEGIVLAYQRMSGNLEPFDTTAFSASDIVLMSSIAPTVFEGIADATPGAAPYHLLAGGADGDVTGGADCEICQSFRIAGAALGTVSTTYVHGASHNVFHDGGWGSFDDGTGPNRLTRSQVHPAMKAWYLALVGWHALGEKAYGEILTRMPSDVRPIGTESVATYAQTWRDALSSDIVMFDDYQQHPEFDRNSAGGRVDIDGLDIAEAILDDDNLQFRWVASDAMNGMTLVSRDGFERGAVVSWTGDASYTSRLPQPADLRDHADVSVRVAQTTRHPLTVQLDAPLTFTIELIDADGDTVARPTDLVGTVTTPYPREGLGAGAGWANEWNTVRIPLRAFTTGEPDLDLDAIVGMRLRFGPSWGSEVGRVGLDDLHITRR